MTEGKLGLVVPSDIWSSLIVQKDSLWDALKELALLGTFQECLVSQKLSLYMIFKAKALV